jgi:hypothetical protein
MFFLGDHVYVLAQYMITSNLMEGLETGRPLYSTIRYYFEDAALEGYKLSS